jgi:ribosomal 50S subunit-associated protein YjgA (DUF615 family)
MNVTTNRAGIIASIIEKRRPLSQKIERVESNLRDLSSTLHHLENYRNDLLAQVDTNQVKLHLQW